MPNKHVLFRSEAREKVLRGAAVLTDAVRVTLGPKSKCVLIDKHYGRPLVCNDGVTIAREVELKDPDENLGVKLVREAAERTGDAVGDGTSTATVLAHAILVDGVRNAVRREEAACPDGDERTGLRILRRALEAPARQIAENSGADPGVAVSTMLAGQGATGFDAARGVYCDLVATGIIDPTKVVRVALENAVSVAGTLLLTEACLTEIPEPAADRHEPAELG